MFETQRDMFKKTRAELKAGQLHLTADFGTHPVQVGPTGKLPDLVFVADFLDENGEHLSVYLDCVPVFDQPESKDWNFVASVMDELHASGFLEAFEHIIWWSDTGPNHFRTSNTLFFFRQFQERTEIKMTICFFAARHGHSKCDGHIGRISQSLTREAAKLHGTLDEWNKKFVETNIAELKFTTVTQHVIARSAKVVKTLVGIKGFLVFTFDNSAPNTVDCQEMFGAAPQRRSFEFTSEEEQKRDERDIVGAAQATRANLNLVSRVPK